MTENSPKLLCMSVLPESFKYENDPHFLFSSQLLNNWSQMHKKLSFHMQADLFKKSKLSVPGKRIVLKLFYLGALRVLA